MAADFSIKANDRLPVLRAVIGADLSAALSVDFIMSPIIGGTPKVNSPATIVQATGAISPPVTAVLPDGSTQEISSGAIVEYAWAAADTDTPGSYKCEWEGHFPGSKSETFPTTYYLTVDVVPDLDAAP